MQGLKVKVISPNSVIPQFFMVSHELWQKVFQWNPKKIFARFGWRVYQADR